MTYLLTDIPSAAHGSRFFLSQTPSGWAADPGEQLGASFMSLAGERLAGQLTLAPEPTRVALKVAVYRDGAWRLDDRGEVVRPPIRVATRPGKLTNLKPSPALLDEFFLGGKAWEFATDALIFESLRLTCAAHSLAGRAWREVNDAVALAIAGRAGVGVTADELPHVDRMQKTVVG